jgi:ubiquinone/menaquinone biosynthesis C-methylase UbiE
MTEHPPLDSDRLDEVSRWYDSNYHGVEDAQARHHRRTAEYFIDRVLPTKVERYLDVACGTGELLAAARQRAAFRAGVDLSSRAIELARERRVADDLRVAPAERLPFSAGAFDVITCMGAIEHFVNPDAALAEMRRVAAPRAAFFFLVPNRDYLAWRLARRPGTRQRAAEETPRTLALWAALFTNAGFRILRLVPDRRPSKMWWVREAKGLRRVFKAANAAALRVLPVTFQYQFLFELRSGDAASA